MIDIRDDSLLKLMPESLKRDKFVAVLAQAVEKELKEAYREAESLANFNDVDKLPEPLLDYLAFQKHVDFYEINLPIEQKRILIKNSIKWHRMKGTPAAVEEVVTSIFGEGIVSEWFEYGGNPHHFKVITSNKSATNEKAEQFLRIVDSVKRKSSKLEKVELSRTEDTNLYFGIVIHTGDNLTIKQVE